MNVHGFIVWLKKIDEKLTDKNVLLTEEQRARSKFFVQSRWKTHITKSFLRSDNTSCYHNTELLEYQSHGEKTQSGV